MLEPTVYAIMGLLVSLVGLAVCIDMRRRRKWLRGVQNQRSEFERKLSDLAAAAQEPSLPPLNALRRPAAPEPWGGRRANHFSSDSGVRRLDGSVPVHSEPKPPKRTAPSESAYADPTFPQHWHSQAPAPAPAPAYEAGGGSYGGGGASGSWSGGSDSSSSTSSVSSNE